MHGRGRRRERHRRRRHGAMIVAALLAAIALAGLCTYGYIHLQAKGALRRYPLEYVEQIRAGAAEFSLEPAYVASIILAESSYNPEALSSADARGLMQLLPSTAEWIAGKLGEPFDEAALYTPAVNIRYGCWYLRFLLDRYDGDMKSATAAYHAGQGSVDRWLKDPQYSPDGEALEVIASAATNTYVNRVLSNYAHYAKIY